MRDDRDAHLVFQRRGDFKQLLFQGVEPLRALQERKLQRKHQEIEAFGLLGSKSPFGRQWRDLGDQFLALVVGDRNQDCGARYFSTERRCWRTRKLSRFSPVTVSCKVFNAPSRITGSLGGGASA